MATEKPKPLVSKATLFAALPVQALLSQLDSGFISEPSDRTDLQNLWQQANRAYAATPSSRSYASTDDTRPLEGVDDAKLNGTLSRIRTYSPYDTHLSEILSVRISKLVTPQIAANLARAERRARLKEGMTEDELFDLAFEAAGKPESITRQTLAMTPNNAALLFTSYDEDIRLHQPPQYREIPINKADPHSPTLESVCLAVGGGLPFAAAYRVQISSGVFRLILANGVHRVYRLASSGYEWCPLVVTDMDPLEFPDPFADLTKDILLDPASNPPLVADFTNAKVVIPLTYFPVLKTIRLNWNFEQYVTVLR